MPKSRQSGLGPLTVRAAVLGAALIAAQSVQAQTTMTLPLYGDGTTGVNAIIDWGDPAANETCPRVVTTEGQVSCTYPAAAGAPPYQIRVSGTVPRFGNGDLGYPNADRITRLVRFGDVGLTSLAGAFRGAERLTQVAADFPDTVTNISYMFKGAVSLDDTNVRNWGMRTRNVTSMLGTFQDALSFSRELDTWCVNRISDTSAVNGFREKTIDGGEITQIRNRLGQMGDTLTSEMKLTAEKEPRWGQCGLSIAATAPAPVQAGAPFSLDLRSRVSLWANAPAEANINAVTFQVTAGSLPPGMTLNTTTGLISGTPTSPGTYTFTVQARQD